MKEQLKAVPVWAWVALLAFVGLGALTYHKYVNDTEDTDWHNPQQPDINLDVKTQDVKQPSSHTRPRQYPGSLSSWGGCVVGDC